MGGINDWKKSVKRTFVDGIAKGNVNDIVGGTGGMVDSTLGQITKGVGTEIKRPGETAKNKEKDAQDKLEENKNTWEGLELPELERLNLEGARYAGDVNSKSISNPYANISTDPRLQEAQNRSLDSLDEIIQGGGMNAMDRANIARDQADAAQQDKGRRDAILQNQQARGMGGSGNSLLAQLQSSQAATDRNSQTGLDVAGMAQQRAMDAIRNSGEMAGSMRSQSFNEQAAKAQGQTSIDQFNEANRINTETGNRDTRQAVNNSGTAARNTSATYNAGIGQQNFNNQVAKTSGATGANTQVAQGLQGQAAGIQQQNAALWSAAIGGGSQIAGAYAGKK